MIIQKLPQDPLEFVAYPGSHFHPLDLLERKASYVPYELDGAR
jgi:hypothetical protein